MTSSNGKQTFEKWYAIARPNSRAPKWESLPENEQAAWSAVAGTTKSGATQKATKKATKKKKWGSSKD